MKIRILIILLFLTFANISLAANYTLTIGEESYDLSLGKEFRIKINDRYLSMKLEKKDIFTFTTDNFSFQHSKQYSPSKTDLGSGIFQTAMMTPLGTTVMVQEYLNLDPTFLMDLMVKEITKEERTYGYNIEFSENSITLSDGKVLKGRVVTSKYKGADIKRYFYFYGVKDSGLFIMTQIDYEIASSEEGVIDRFLNSLKVTMK